MKLWAILAGLGLGAVGALLHLAVTHWRARHVVDRGPTVTLLAMPLGLLGPAIAVLAAAQLAPESAWATLAGMLIARFAVLHRLRAPR